MPASLEGDLVAFQHLQPWARSGQGSSWPSSLLPPISVSLACPVVGDGEPAPTLSKGMGKALFFLSLVLSSWDSHKHECLRETRVNVNLKQLEPVLSSREGAMMGLDIRGSPMTAKQA